MVFYLGMASALTWAASSYFWIRSAMLPLPMKVSQFGSGTRIATDGNNMFAGLIPGTPEEVASYLKVQTFNNKWASITSAVAAALAALAVAMQSFGQ